MDRVGFIHRRRHRSFIGRWIRRGFVYGSWRRIIIYRRRSRGLINRRRGGLIRRKGRLNIGNWGGLISWSGSRLLVSGARVCRGMREVGGGQDLDLWLGGGSFVVHRLGILDLGRGMMDGRGMCCVMVLNRGARGAWPGMMVRVLSHSGPLLAAADPEEVPERSCDVIDKVGQKRVRVTLVPD